MSCKPIIINCCDCSGGGSASGGTGSTSRDGMKYWETDWFDIVPLGSYTFNLSAEILEIEPEYRHARLMAKVKADAGNWREGDIFTLDTTNFAHSVNQEVGSTIIFRDSNVIVAFGENSHILYVNPNGGVDYGLTKSSVQIKLLIDAGQA